MPSPRRRDPTAAAAAAAAAGDQFTFSIPHRADPDPSMGTEYERWAERIKGKYNYFGRLEDVNYGAWTRKTTKNESDTPSPELWRAERPSVRSAGSSPVRNSHDAPAARYRQEMLDLVRDVPETAYELSLMDMVESTKIARADDTSSTMTERKKEKKRGKKSLARSESMDTGGLMLKMFAPRVPFGRRRQSFSANSGAFAKVSPPRSGVGEGEKRRAKEEWWSSSSSRTSSISSTNSSGSASSTSSSLSSRIIGSCYPFITHKGKSVESED